MTLYKWSQTAASDATADSTINWAEGQSPSSVNDSARAMMAATAKWRDDISGAIVTGGTSTAYTVTSYQVFSTLALMNGAMIAFTPHATNGATVTLNVDGLGAKPLRSSPSVELLAGTLILGTPYVATYNNSDAAWYLQGFVGNPYNVPLGGMLIHTVSTAPNSSFVLPYGQAISRTTYSAYFAAVGTGYGAGDGSTTFNVPDLRGRGVFGADNMGGSAASRITSASSMGTGLLGQVGGAETATLVTANLPAYTPAGTIVTTVTPSQNVLKNSGGNSVTPPGTIQFVATDATVTTFPAVSTFTGTAQGGTSTAVNKMPPAICLNYILRII